MSRKEAAKQIIAGNVLVNGKAVKSPGKIVHASSEITIQGEKAEEKSKAYILLNKPANCITSRHDPEGRRTVYDILKTKEWVFPAGRLDYDTSGLLIMTNDSELADYITSPKSSLWKTYVAKIKGNIEPGELRQIESGIMLDGEKTLPAKAKVLAATGLSTRIELQIREGRNRQARRMLEALGKKVISLARTAIGELQDAALKPGTYRKLSQEEIALLKKER